MAWVVLIVSGMLETAWATSLKASEGFTRLWPSVIFFLTLAASMAGLAYALRTLPVGTAYAVWVGIGASLTAIIGMIWLAEGVNAMKIVSLVLIVAGVVGLNLAGGGHTGGAGAGPAAALHAPADED
ncbi:multidrug efflux SMR transporter [Ruania suaedae]|uniref:DMT family transporter n=1 Tax=Ruania suaedae TaxID=2897774 RepID=UPI001E2D48D3|nr:multidrug efflux SMR transporter [Ruania suaedae]UFU02488.1 multidrug efflux SMR transporter [Ruania suaedae]